MKALSDSIARRKALNPQVLAALQAFGESAQPMRLIDDNDHTEPGELTYATTSHQHESSRDCT